MFNPHGEVTGILPIGESKGKKKMSEFRSLKHKGSNSECANTAMIALLFFSALSQTGKYCLPFILELSTILNLEGYFCLLHLCLCWTWSMDLELAGFHLITARCYAWVPYTIPESIGLLIYLLIYILVSSRPPLN